MSTVRLAVPHPQSSGRTVQVITERAGIGRQRHRKQHKSGVCLTKHESALEEGTPWDRLQVFKFCNGRH